MHTIGLSRAWRMESYGADSLVAKRHFSSPTGLKIGQPVWVQLRPRPGCQLKLVDFNGKELLRQPCSNDPGNCSHPLRWEITELLPSNQLRIAVSVLHSSAAQSAELGKRLLDMSLWLEAELQIE